MIFDFQDYRKFVLSWIHSHPKRGRGQYQKIAKHLHVHSTLVSQIFKGDRELTLEQATLLTNYLGLNELETDYFLLLVLRERAGSVHLQLILDRQIEKMQSEAHQLIRRLSHTKRLNQEDQAIFYSAWFYSAVRLLTSIPHFQTREKIYDYFDLPSKLIDRVLDFLTSKSLCLYRDGKYQLGPSVTHLESTAPFAPQHHMNWRHKAMERYHKLEDDELIYSAPLTLSEKDALEFRADLVKFIEVLGKRVRPSSPERLMCFNVDWFRIPSKN